MCIYKIGIEVLTPDGVMSAGAILIMCSVDLPARAMVLNTKQWNGAYGCAYCEDEGTCVGGDHLHRYWPQIDPSIARTHSSVLVHAERATSTGAAVSVHVYTVPPFIANSKQHSMLILICIYL